MRDLLFYSSTALTCTMFIPARVPRIVKGTMSSMLWSVAPTAENIIYLTFDDGPIPVVTPWVVETLRSFNAKATFFCVGDNAAKHPELLEQLSNEGHRIGNHTFNHLNGWKTADREYLRNVIQASEVLETELFRPPYGKLKPSQSKVLRKQYRIVMWSVLTQDYDQNISGEQCLQNALSCRNGDIVLFHDSIKAEENLRYALPKFLEHYSKLGFEFRTL